MPSSNREGIFRRMLSDVRLDVDNWQKIISYIECQRKCDLKVLRKTMLQTYTLMHDIRRSKKSNYAATSRESYIQVQEYSKISEESNPVLTIVKDVKSLLAKWTDTLRVAEREIKASEPGDMFWNMVLRSESIMFQLLTVQVPYNPRKARNKQSDTDVHRLSQLEQKEDNLQTKLQDLEQTNKQLKEEIDKLKTNTSELIRQQEESEGKLKLEIEVLNTQNNEMKCQVERLTSEREQQSLPVDIDSEVDNLIEEQELQVEFSDDTGDKADVDEQSTIEQTAAQLGEMFTQLFDEEWLRAFSSLKELGHSDREAFMSLKQILLDSLEFCKRKYEKITDGMAAAINLRDMVELCAPEGLTETVMTSIQIKHLIHSLSEKIVPVIEKEYMLSYWNEDIPGEMKPYIEKCLFVTWMMTVQEPPMTFAIPADVTDTTVTLDTSMYRHYMTTGTSLDYTVWPCLLLHENGPVVAKGVAEANADD